METNTKTAATTSNQPFTVRGQTIYATIVVNGQQERHVVVTKRPYVKGDRPHGYSIPLSLAALGGGKDAWMRQIVARCPDCKTPVKLEESQGENCLCSTCWDRVEAEMIELNS